MPRRACPPQFTDISVVEGLTRRTNPSHSRLMDDLINDIAAFCETHHLRESRFGRSAVGDTMFVRQLREGREPRRATVQKVRQFMATYRPERVAA